MDSERKRQTPNDGRIAFASIDQTKSYGCQWQIAHEAVGERPKSPRRNTAIAKPQKKTQGEAVPHPGLNRLRFSRIRYSSGSLPLWGSRWGGRRRCGLVVVTMMRLTRACAGAWICRIDAGR